MRAGISGGRPRRGGVAVAAVVAAALVGSSTATATSLTPSVALAIDAVGARAATGAGSLAGAWRLPASMPTGDQSGSLLGGGPIRFRLIGESATTLLPWRLPDQATRNVVVLPLPAPAWGGLLGLAMVAGLGGRRIGALAND